MIRKSFVHVVALAGALSLVASAALAQQTDVSALAAEGYEVKAMTTFDIDPSDTSDQESVFVIMQNGADVYGCVLQSSTTSFCQRIQ